jgi:hypothetical protein
MNEIQVERDDVGRRRIAVERVIEGITRSEDDDISRIGHLDGRNRRMPAIVTLGIVGTPFSGLGELHDMLAVPMVVALAASVVGGCRRSGTQEQSERSAEHGSRSPDRLRCWSWHGRPPDDVGQAVFETR